MDRLSGRKLPTVALCAVLALGLVGCGGDEETTPGRGMTQKPAEEVKETQKDETSADSEEREGKTSEQSKQNSEEAESSDAESRGEGMVQLDPDLPNPMFAGTPRDFASDILDPNTGEQRGEIYVPGGMTDNVARGKEVTSSSAPIMGKLSQITDGDKSGKTNSHVSFPGGKLWVQIDLEKKHKIAALLVWHFHANPRIYHDVIVQVSNDKDFSKGVKTLYNSDQDNSLGMGAGDNYEYVETSEGRLIKADGTEARYVRLYSNGSTSNALNHYVEVAVYGKPTQ